MLMSTTTCAGYACGEMQTIMLPQTAKLRDPDPAFVFDDTFEHEAWNDSDVRRALVSRVSGDVSEFYGTGSYHEGGS